MSAEERLSTIVRYVSPLLAVACIALTACSRQSDTAADRVASATGLRGTPLSEPLPKPSFVLPRTDGLAYDFARETQGKVALLFFGYTHCPDVCPLHMANIAAVLAKMPWEEREAIRVIFVTTDPERDTPERLGTWLAGFDPEFVGLRGAADTVGKIQHSLGITPASRQPSTDSGEYLVGHAAQVIAFGRDNMARIVYPFGTRQDDWAHDLPLLARGEGDIASATPQHSSQADVSILERAIAPAVIVPGTDSGRGALYLTIQTYGPQEDTLFAVSPIGGGVASLHVSTARGGSVTMKRVRSIPIPGRSLLAMLPGGMHVMLDSMPRALIPGASLPFELLLSGGKKVIVSGTVVTYAQLDSVLALQRASFSPR